MTLRTLLGAAALLALAASAAAPGAPARAREDCDGVWVVVDARELGGPATTRCAAGDPPSGLEALSMAGHAYSFVPRQPGMVCTIDGRPDPCNGAPADAYWSYWHAEPGGSWTYARRGAGERDPEPGTVDGWAFGAGDPPATAPPEDDAGADEPSDGDGTDEPSDGDGTDEPSDGDSADATEDDTDAAEAEDATDDGTQDAGAEDGPDDAGAEDPPAEDDPAPRRGEDGADAAAADETDTPEDGPDDAAADDAPTARGPDDVPRAGAADGDGAGDGSSDDEPGQRAERDVVAVGRSGGGGGTWTGVAAGTALAGGLAGAAVWQVRRRRLAP